MASIDVFNGDQEKYIQFDSDTEVLIAYLDKSDVGEIRKKAKKLASKSNMEYEEAFNFLLGKRAVKGWRKVKDHKHPGLIFNNKPFPFNEDNRDFLMRKSIDFASFVNGNTVDPEPFREEEEAKEETKNV